MNTRHTEEDNDFKCKNCGSGQFEDKNGVRLCMQCKTAYRRTPRIGKDEDGYETIIGFREVCL